MDRDQLESGLPGSAGHRWRVVLKRMCSVVILRRPDHPRWPLLLAANRDELGTRQTLAPARHWPDRPDVVAGLDL
jgi:hypothetical protein